MREDWTRTILEDLLDYIQPQKYIVESTEYDNKYKTPVLTAGKSFIKGYTNETNNIFDNLPVIIFDDFTTATQFVNFKFKVKSSAMKILVPTSPLVNIKYVFYFMRTIRQNTDTHKRYWISQFSQLPIPLAPLPEQRAIVAKLEQLFSELDNGIANLQASKAKLDIYSQAVLKKAFEGELTKEWRDRHNDLPTADELLEQIRKERLKHYEYQLKEWKEAVAKWEYNGKQGKRPSQPNKPKNSSNRPKTDVGLNQRIPRTWKLVSPEQVASPEKYSIGIGPFGSNLKVSDYTKFGVPLIFVRHITSGNFKENLRFTSDVKYIELVAHSVKPLDILITKMGDPPGDCSIYPANMPNGIITSDCLKFRVWDRFVERMYFKYCIESLIIKKQLGLITQGVAQKKISTQRFKTVLFPLPPKDEQTQIVQEIETRLSVCDNILANIEEGLEKAEALRQSILKQAFEGKLLSDAELEACRKEPDWEPAGVLLERIKNEKLFTS